MVAGAGGIAVFKAYSEPDPLRAMAFVPVEAPVSMARPTALRVVSYGRKKMGVGSSAMYWTSI